VFYVITVVQLHNCPLFPRVILWASTRET